MLFPYSVDVSLHRWPIANFGILAALVLAFLLELQLPEEALDGLVLRGWSLGGILGHMWLHLSAIHLAGNFLFLWAFGNAVCAKVGDARFALAYLGFGIAAALAHLIVDGRPAIGASGAINGVVGLYLALYPTNQISCFYWAFFRFGTFAVSGFWMILLWFAFDILGAVRGVGSAAYVAHLGGFATGFALGWVMLREGWIAMSITERSILDVLGVKTREGHLPQVAVRCSCGRSWRVSGERRGERFRCPSCRAVLKVPGA